MLYQFIYLLINSLHLNLLSKTTLDKQAWPMCTVHVTYVTLKNGPQLHRSHFKQV